MNRCLIIICVFFCAILFPIGTRAQEGDNWVGISTGFQFPSTINANLSLERALAYGNAFDLRAEIGNHWQSPACHRFWKGYYWDFGAGYKKRLARYKNSMLRLRFGTHLGAWQHDFFMGCGLSVEYDYVFASGVKFCFAQVNDFNFFAGDHFRNGITVGVKFPL